MRDTTDDIVFAESAAVSPVAIYQMVADPVDRAGNTVAASNKVYVDGNNQDGTEWAKWGINNLLCDDLALKLRKTGVLNAGIKAKARIALGKGIAPVLITGRDKDGSEQMEFIYDPEIEDWLELNHDFFNSLHSIKDMIGFAWTHQRIYLSNDGTKIASFKTDDVVKCRMGKKNPATGEIEYTFYSPCWHKQFNVDASDKYKKISMLRENSEWQDLTERIDEGTKEKEFSIISRGDLDGQEYYPYPLWYSVYDWVDLAIRIPAMKIAMFNNQMSIKYLVKINTKYFERGDKNWNSYSAEDKQAKFKAKVDEINTHLVGNEKAYKSISVQSYVDNNGNEISDISIEVLDDKVKEGKLLPDSSASDKQILFSLMMNPTIMGANTIGGAEGGAGSGSDIREAYLVQIMLMEAERRMNSKIFNIVKRFNGWNKKTYKVKNADGTEKEVSGQNLQFRYPNLILTTLDKGGSIAPVNT